MSNYLYMTEMVYKVLGDSNYLKENEGDIINIDGNVISGTSITDQNRQDILKQVDSTFKARFGINYRKGSSRVIGAEKTMPVFKNCIVNVQSISFATDMRYENSTVKIKYNIPTSSIATHLSCIDSKFDLMSASSSRISLRNMEFVNSTTKLTLGKVDYHRLTFNNGTALIKAESGELEHITVGNSCKMYVDISSNFIRKFNVKARSSIEGTFDACSLRFVNFNNNSMVDVKLDRCTIGVNNGVWSGIYIGNNRNTKIEIKGCRASDHGKIASGGIEFSGIKSLDINIDPASCRLVSLTKCNVISRSELQKIIDNGGTVDEETKKLSGLL